MGLEARRLGHARTSREPGNTQVSRLVRTTLLTSLTWIASTAGLWAQTGTAAAIVRQGNGRGAPACVTCHGPRLLGDTIQGFPRLAGLSTSYVVAQLDAFATGERTSAVMLPVASSLTPPEREVLGRYLQGLESPPAPPEAAGVRSEATTVQNGSVLATVGRWSDDIPACDRCHGPAGAGVADAFPPLTGQPSLYLSRQLRAWKEGTRPPGPLDLMGAIASRMTDADIDATAAYYGLGPDTTVSPTSAVGAAGPVEHASPDAERYFRPPPRSAIPDDPFGREVRLGERIFEHTNTLASRYTGNPLTCANCHIDAGRRPNSAPIWAAFVNFPAYRSKNGRVNTFQERIQGCFRYSMNGRVPPLGDSVLVALESYAAWLSTGARHNEAMPGRGYPKLAQPPRAPDFARGRKVFAERCALCHGTDGQGRRARGVQVFPPLWGARSFNWGAGMGNVDKAAAFIQANMPLGLGGSLSLQDAWDVAMFVDGHERPQDPRFDGSVARTRALHHDSRWSLYGRTVEGVLLGEHSPAPGGTTRRR